jgi:hypothetical protein
MPILYTLNPHNLAATTRIHRKRGFTTAFMNNLQFDKRLQYAPARIDGWTRFPARDAAILAGHAKPGPQAGVGCDICGGGG